MWVEPRGEQKADTRDEQKVAQKAVPRDGKWAVRLDQKLVSQWVEQLAAS